MSLFIAFEGIDGSGKSTIATNVYAALKQQGHTIILSREPTDTEVGKFVQTCIKTHSDPYVTAFAFISDRILHNKDIEQWLASGSIVLCDRYAASTYAYQGAQLQKDIHNPMKWLQGLSKNLIREPDHTFLFDLDPEIAIQRIQHRSELIPFEKKSFLTAVRQNYLKLAQEHHYHILDATQSIQDVTQNCLKQIQEKLIK
ncbi:MAG: dTMP kinase [Candidatus Thermoplasmatota archaeon]|nr:dTMP kinase [Candidatus Thermoplasmatota archaeon]MBU1941477.1 dTMP kinase [Candidatus Thermoplasmatota archaeon]